MDQHDWPAEQFEANRSHLRSVAYRMLGSLAEADDAVQGHGSISAAPAIQRSPNADGSARGRTSYNLDCARGGEAARAKGARRRAIDEVDRAGDSDVGDVDRARQREIVAAFLAAARGGDFGASIAASGGECHCIPGRLKTPCHFPLEIEWILGRFNWSLVTGARPSGTTRRG
jgi:hypothetical protein